MYPDYMWDMVDSHTAKERTRADKAEERVSELEARLAKIEDLALELNGVYPRKEILRLCREA